MTTPPELRSLDRGPSAVIVLARDEAVRTAVHRGLTQSGREALSAGSVRGAAALLEHHLVGCLVLDAADDLADWPSLLEDDPAIGVVLLETAGGTGAAAGAGARVERLTKPVDLADLHAAVERALGHHASLRDNRQISGWLQEEVGRSTAELRRERERLQSLSVAVLETLVNALEAKDPHLRGHSSRVADLSARIAAEYGLDRETVERVRAAGRLHDIGKIGVSEGVLHKEGPLSDEEYRQIKAHTELGAAILAPLSHLGEAIGWVRHHHERWDGSGYPDGLAGEAIPLGARIIGAAEIFDALTTPRPYQAILTTAEGLARFRDLAGTMVDPSVAAALARVFATGTP